MSQFTCYKSGLALTVPLFSISLPASAHYQHPIFSLSQKQLMSMIPRQSSYTPEEQYLYFLALLDSTELVHWKHNAQLTTESLAVAYQFSNQLIQLLGQINIIKHPAFACPQLVIYKENANLSSVSGFLHGLESAIQDWKSAYRSVSLSAKLARRKEVLEYWIKDPQKDMLKFSYILADWASLALQFPTHQYKNKSITCSAYWQQIIVACCSNSRIFEIPTADLLALIDYCEVNIEQGSIYSHALLSHLYTGRDKQKDFLGFGQVTYTVLTSGTSIETANKLAIISNAPTTQPIPDQYPSKLSYLKAKLAYDMAIKAKLEELGSQSESI